LFCSRPYASFNPSATSFWCFQGLFLSTAQVNGLGTYGRDLLSGKRNTLSVCLPGYAEEGSLSCFLDAGVPIGDDQADPGETSFFAVLEQSRPEFLILTIHDFRSQDLPVAVFLYPGDHQDRLGDVPCSVLVEQKEGVVTFPPSKNGPCGFHRSTLMHSTTRFSGGSAKKVWFESKVSATLCVPACQGSSSSCQRIGSRSVSDGVSLDLGIREQL